MIADKNKNIDSIDYNYLNLPVRVKKHTGEAMTYTYDASGRKLQQKVYNASGTLIKTTDYDNEFIYQGDTLQFISHDEGRVVMTGISPEYQYQLKDHLGNVRLMFTATPPAPETITEGFEGTSNQGFDYVTNSTYPYGHSGSNSAYLPSGLQILNMAAAKSAHIYPGDKVELSGWGYSGSYAWNTSSDMSYWLTWFVAYFGLGMPAPGETHTASSALAAYGDLIADNYEEGTTDSTDPKVFFTILAFDTNYNLIDAKYQQISGTDTWVSMDVSYTAVQESYVYCYVSNEDWLVHSILIDDISYTYTPGPVVQAEDYYPFGLTFNSYSRENSDPNLFQYNGKERQDGFGIGWLDYGARMYMPEIGRFNAIDPMSETYNGISSYSYAIDNPIRFVDILGMGPGDRVRFARSYLRTPYPIEDVPGQTQWELSPALRADYTKEGLAFMDCAELVSRVLAEDGLTDGVVSGACDGLIKEVTAKGSNWKEVTESPVEGDIILWEGHTAIVEDYDKESGMFKVIHSTRYTRSSSGECIQGVVEESIYSKSYYTKKGAKFYRPIAEKTKNGHAPIKNNKKDNKAKVSSEKETANDSSNNDNEFSLTPSSSAASFDAMTQFVKSWAPPKKKDN